MKKHRSLFVSRRTHFHCNTQVNLVYDFEEHQIFETVRVVSSMCLDLG